ncbi:MAG: PilC/PilY family type IV pilus protein, partial [Betaproteobacteria bacterium]
AAVPSATTFTYVYSAPAPLASGSSGTVTKSNGNLATLLKWIRGQDTQDENGFKVNGADTDVRASIHGDVLHSRPVVLNFGRIGSSDNVYVFYGGNDGVFRAVKGGQASTDGKEQWAFIPQEFFGKFKRLFDNTPPVLYPSTPASLTPTPAGTCDPTTTACATKRGYLWDGPVGSYVERNAAGDVTRAYLYLAARRGGRFLYALDVTTPTSPKFLWKKGCTAAGVCDSGFAELGQTWSQAQVVRVEASEAGGNPVVMLGAGYDAVSEDTDPPAATDTVGRGVLVLNAFTGALIWSAGNSANSPTVAVSGMNFSVAADVLPLDRRQTGFIDRVYAADVGGNLWRLDVGGTTTANWRVWKIASIANRSVAADRRKFLFGPDAVFGEAGTFDAIVIGTGDREHPLNADAASGVVNRAYMFVDPNTGGAGADLNITESNLFDATNSSSVDLTNPSIKGWYVTLKAGEKVVNGPIVVASKFIFGTNQPCASGKLDASGNCTTGTASSLSCTGNLGIARRYDINYLTGAAEDFTDSTGASVRSEVAPGGGFLPSPTAGLVEISGKAYVFVTDNPLNIGGVINPGITAPTKRFRTYWREVLE